MSDGLWINGKFVLASSGPKCCAISASETHEIVELALELQRENAELKAHNERLRSNIVDAINELALTNKDRMAKSRAVGFLNEAFFETPAQSLADHDMRIAERVRNTCWKIAETYCGNKTVGIEAIRNLDLSEVIKDD